MAGIGGSEYPSAPVPVLPPVPDGGQGTHAGGAGVPAGRCGERVSVLCLYRELLRIEFPPFFHYNVIEGIFTEIRRALRRMWTNTPPRGSSLSRSTLGGASLPRRPIPSPSGSPLTMPCGALRRKQALKGHPPQELRPARAGQAAAGGCGRPVH